MTRGGRKEHSLLRGDRPVLAAPVERDGGDLVAGEVVEALVRVSYARAVDRGVDLLDDVGGAVHDRGAGVDDRVEARGDALLVRANRGTGDLPEAGRGVHGVGLELVGEELVVHAAEVELRARLGELEAEGLLLDSVLLDSSVEEGVLRETECQMSSERKTL